MDIMTINWQLRLRKQVRDATEQWANANGLNYFESTGHSRTIVLQPSADGSSHGNFLRN